MEKETGNRDQISRLNDIQTAYDTFTEAKKVWDDDLDEISNAVYEMPDFAISRIRAQINSEDNGWYCNESGCFEIENQGEDNFPDLDDLTELIVNALE